MEYKYPHFEIWSHYLTPIEIAYVILWTYSNDEKFTNIDKLDVPTVELQYDDDYHSSSELILGVPVRKKGEEQATLYMSYTCGGGQYGGSSGSYYDPPEPPTIYLDDLNIDELMFYTGIDEIDITPEEVIKAKVNFTYKDMIYLATKIGINTVEVDEVSASLETELSMVDGRRAQNYPNPKRNVTAIPKMNFPPELIRKLDTIIKQKDVQTRISSNRFGL